MQYHAVCGKVSASVLGGLAEGASASGVLPGPGWPGSPHHEDQCQHWQTHSRYSRMISIVAENNLNNLMCFGNLIPVLQTYLDFWYMYNIIFNFDVSRSGNKLYFIHIKSRTMYTIETPHINTVL